VSTIVHVQASDIPIEIETRGGVPDGDIEYLSERLERVLRPVAGRTIQCRALMSVHHERDPEAQARVRVTIHAKGETIRSEVIAPSVRDAISGVESRLQRQLEHRAKRARNDPRGKAPTPGEWRHGNQHSPKQAGFARPVEDREIVTRKSPTTPRSTLDEARWDRFVLGYDFFLFVDTDTGRDALLTTGDDDDEVLVDITDAPRMLVDDAATWLDETGRDFHFFCDEANGRGAVIYRRYDGHYGLLTPSNLEQE
jgi:ribosome-associated translation inhibitor RaiA